MVHISVVNIKYFIGRSVLLKNSYAIISKYLTPTMHCCPSGWVTGTATLGFRAKRGSKTQHAT